MRQFGVESPQTTSLDGDFLFQQDGTPLHFHYEMTSYLNRTVICWIGRGGTITWPTRSPDLTPLEFSVWGYVKDKVLLQLFLQVWKTYGHG